MSGPLALKDMVVSPFEMLVYVTGYLAVTFNFFRDSYAFSQKEDFYSIAEYDKRFGLFYDSTCMHWNQGVMKLKKAWWTVLLYLIVSKILRRLLNPEAWCAACSLLAAFVMINFFGWKVYVMFWTIITLHALPALLLRSRVALWLVHLGIYAYFSTDRSYKLMKNVTGREVLPTLFPTVAWLPIRCMSFFDSMLRLNTPILTKSNFAIFLHYIFFIPVLTDGPIIAYQDFARCVYKPIQPKTSFFLIRCVRVALTILVLRLSYHIYYSAFALFFDIITTEATTLLGFFYLNGIRFHLAYVALYGTAKISSAFIGIETPEWPRCISRIYSYTEMWKTFDVGLYNYLKEHIYIPLGGSRFGTVRMILASVGCFLYIGNYHGRGFGVWMWIILNIFQMLGEMAVVRFYRSDFAKPLVTALSPAWTRRIFGVIGGISFVLSCVSFFYFNIGYEKTNLKMQAVNQYAYWPLFFLLGFTITQLSIECHVRGWIADKKEKVEVSPKSDVAENGKKHVE